MNNTPTTIYLIRHGEVDNPKGIIYGRLDLPLHPKGFEQIEALAKKLRDDGVKPSVIYTSLQQRAVQSARKIAEVFGNTPIIEETDLQDTSSPGLEKQTLDWLKTIGGDVYNYHGPEVEGITIERPEVIVERMMETIREIRQKHQGETVFVVSHGDPIAFTFWRLLNPEGNLPSTADLAKRSYLKKGEAWRMVFNKEGKVLEYELITLREREIKGEREY